MHAVIDIGSNTIRLNIYKVFEKNFTKILTNKSYAGLANYVENGRLTMAGIQKAVSVLYSFKKIIDNLDIKQTLVFATASLRNIDNSDEAKVMIEKLSGIEIEIISGEEEGRLGYIGARYDVDLQEGLLIDIGGSSTEIVEFRKNKIIKSTSFPIGSLKAFKNNVSDILPSEKEYQAITNECKKVFPDKSLLSYSKNLDIIGIGGSIRSLSKLNNHTNSFPRSNIVITKEELGDLTNFLLKDYKLSRDAILKKCPERIHTIIPGLCILNYINKKVKAKSILVSNYGAREGYLAKYL